MNEKKTDNKFGMRALQDFLTICPQIIKPGIGLEAFTEDLIKASEKFTKHFHLDER